MPLFRALAKNMAPMTNADESQTNRLTLFPIYLSLFVVSTLCLDRGRRRRRRRENDVIRTTTDIYFRFDLERQICIFASIFVFSSRLLVSLDILISCKDMGKK